MQTAEQELKEDNDSLVCCWGCGAFHWNRDSRCPFCGAGLVHQCWGETKDGKPVNTHENHAKAYEARAARLRADAAKMEERAQMHRAAKG